MKAYEVVQHHIEDKILEGEFSVGSALPAERDLAIQLGVSRTAVREGLRTLAAQGLITSQVGAGPESGTRIADQHTPALGKLLKLHVALSQFPVDDVVACRIMLERSSAALAARNADDQDIKMLGELLTAMESPQMVLNDFNPLDTAFHVAIGEIGDNQLVAVLTAAVREALAEPIHHASTQMADWQEFRQHLCSQHRKVFEAIAAHDARRAADLVEDHIRFAYRILPMTGKPAS